MTTKQKILDIIKKRKKQMARPSNISPYAKNYAQAQFKKLIQEVEDV